ncbi:MAG: RagB/SusD family nutrient uptake outer membrane protein, partial [Bacteroidaceae bacterium]|nr:RagB/SusD family nutrient uptake outer membrane protein [Bacteroidaceae bacterium]
TGDTGTAEKVLRQIVDAKGIEIAEGVFEGITDARQQLLLYGIGNFAFYKRNGVAVKELGIKEYQQLLPIPRQELYANPNMTQNPEYDS